MAHLSRDETATKMGHRIVAVLSDMGHAARSSNPTGATHQYYPQSAKGLRAVVSLQALGG
jgi:hypothetical protein